MARRWVPNTIAALTRTLGLGLSLALALLPLAGAQAGDQACDPALEPLSLAPPKALQVGFSPGETMWFRFLPAHQAPDGGWSAKDWDRWSLGRAQLPEPRLPGRAQRPHDVAVSGLALAAFVGAGYTHRGSHPNAQVVRRGADALRRRQAPDGSFTRASDPDPLTGHALATLALTELYGMSSSVLYEQACRSGLEHLLSTRGPNGVWQRPDSEEDDALATLWGALALKSAELINKDRAKRGDKAPLSIDPTRALARIVAWLDTRTDAETGLMRPLNEAERLRGGTTSVLTAGAALLRILTRSDAQLSARLRGALTYLTAHPVSSVADRPESDQLYAYFGTRATYQAGGEAWKIWRGSLSATVVSSQDHSDPASMLRSSWTPRGAWARERGRVASTALCAMLLQDFYSYDGVFGSSSGQRGSLPARIEALPAARTWQHSALPSHAARMKLVGGGSLPIDALHIQAQVRAVRAQVVLDFFVTNNQGRPQQGVLDLKLPPGATPYYLAFGEAELASIPPPGPLGRRGTNLTSLRSSDRGEWGQVREARMAPVARATEAFETIANRGKDPALLTWEGAGVFHLRVFPLLPGRQHRIVVAYEVDLVQVGNSAELELPLAPDLRNVHVAVRAPGATWDATPAAKLAAGTRTWHEPRGNAIRVRVQREGDCWLVGRAAGKAEYTAAWVRPEVPKLPREGGAHALFLVDVSSSIAAAQMQVWQKLVPAILEANRDRIKTFTATFFDMRTHSWRRSPSRNTPENVAALRAALGKLEPGGATDLAGALASARTSPPGTDVFLFTDGDRSWGPTSPSAVLSALPHSLRIYAYATGLGGEDRAMLRAITERSEGALFTVLGPAEVAHAARAHRHQPWLIDSLALSGVSDLLVAADPVRIYPGQRLHLTGRGRPASGAELVLALRRGARTHTLRIPVPAPLDSPMAARAYGRAGVERLEEAGARHEKLAQDYASNFRVVRRSSALLMLESEADYKRFGLTGTGAAERVARTPIHEALGREAHKPRTSTTSTRSSVLAFARRQELPEPLLALLGQAPPGKLELPPDPSPKAHDALLRTLGGRFESGDAGAALQLALQAYADGMPRHAFEVLLRSATNAGTAGARGWLMARAAARAERPLLAILAYEAALGGNISHTEVSWVVAADYERYLRGYVLEYLRGGKGELVTQFARARLETLRQWREGLDGFAPIPQADVVVLHVPFHRDDESTIQLRAPVKSTRVHADLEAPRSNLTLVPERPVFTRVQMTALRTLKGGSWQVRLKRPTQKRTPTCTQRSLVIVIRDWGRSSERVVLVRSVGPDEEFLYRLESE